MASALLLARDGHRVTLMERDHFDVGLPEDAPRWQRRGIPHFLQPHAFIPRGRKELREHLPDVYEALLAAGARDVDLRPKLPGGDARDGDDHLQYLAVRRPLLEWALRRAVMNEPGIELCPAKRVDGLPDGLVVDALGRRSPTPGWLAEDNAATSDCGVVYYSRYYRQHSGFELPDGPWLLSPRGDLGYCAFATFPGDNGTFAALLAVPTGVAEWQVLRNARAFDAAVAAIPALRLWVDPDGVDPITDVLPMAGLRNSLRRWDPERSSVVPVGDALSHTDPVLAHGLSFALVHAVALLDTLRHGGNLSRYAEQVLPAARERYALATDLDEQRHRMWTGGAVDPGRPDGDYALFTMSAAAAVAMIDPDVFRVFVRRIGLLDPTSVLDDDAELQRRIAERFNELRRAPRPPGGPTRDEMVALTRQA